MDTLIYPDEAYAIIGCSIEVHNHLGHGFLEILYKDALEYEFNKKGIPYSREEQFKVSYKSTILRHRFHADFTVFDKIILEVKAQEGLPDTFYAQTINYLKVSNYKLGLLVNFGRGKLSYKRIVY